MKTLKDFLKIDEELKPHEVVHDSIRLTPGENRLHSSLSDHYAKEVHPHISSPEHDTLGRYTNNDSGKINNHLLRGGSTYLQDERERQVSHIDSAIQKSKLPHDVETVSGLGFDPRQYGLGKEGDKLHLKAYTSTTIKPAISRKFSMEGPAWQKHYMVFHLKKNQRALYLSSKHGPVSQQGEDEHELLLPRDSHVRLIKHQTLQGERYSHHFWHVEVHHPE